MTEAIPAHTPRSPKVVYKRIYVCFMSIWVPYTDTLYVPPVGAGAKRGPASQVIVLSGKERGHEGREWAWPNRGTLARAGMVAGSSGGGTGRKKEGRDFWCHLV